MLGVSGEVIRTYIFGRTAIPLEKFDKLCYYLDTTPHHVLYG